MNGECPICDHPEIEDGEEVDLAWEEFNDGDADDPRFDHLGLKRELEARYDISLTITSLKNHYEHSRYFLSNEVVQ